MLSRCRLDVCHTSIQWTGLNANLGRRSETLKRAARGSLQIQDAKIAKKSPSAHHRTTLSGYILAIKAHIDNQKKKPLNSNISPTCPYNMVNFGH